MSYKLQVGLVGAVAIALAFYARGCGDVRFELTTSVPQERRSRGALWDGARRRGERANAAREWRESARASGAGREERALDFSGSKQASLVYRSSTRVCVRNCISIRRPEFECSGPQLEGPEFECSGPQLEGPEFEYSELFLKVCGSRYCELDRLDRKRNEDIMQELQLQPVSKFINKYQLQWKNHVQGMNRNRLPRTMLQYRIPGKRSLGRPKEKVDRE
ncbi:hypothetical protein ANN_23590 [Periplaneta americana]|uniref:Uncharacterized protein n=1 Tax=Periplaneta americana TaxID=6978 RepID=A0ABQ8SMU9_PERAM|nr:hypothetical protein ANN_23590 [Periplaneta americana]